MRTSADLFINTMYSVMQQVIFINSHPIQYFAPLYKHLNEDGVRTKAWYCSDESIKGGRDRQFGVSVQWDIPMLDGYEHKFFRNFSWKPSHANGFFGLVNFGMLRQLFREPKSVIVVHGWHYFTHLFIIILGHMAGHTICLRNETPLRHEMLKKGWKRVPHGLVLKWLIFPWVHYFLYIGKQNKMFYQHYDVSDHRLIFCPYSVDNSRFKNQYKQLKAERSSLKKRLGISNADKVIVYSGKYISKKRPLDLLKAYVQLGKFNCWLVMVGEGEQRREMEKLIAEHGLMRVLLTGFINQSKIAEYYAIADVFVMCSSVGETWGLSVNEAMNFNLPIIVSDLTGCANDLVKSGDNGYVFQTGNVDQLAEKLNDVLFGKTLQWQNPSEIIVDEYSYATISKKIQSILEPQTRSQETLDKTKR